MEEKTRCAWCETHPIYIDYHDREWGTPVEDDNKHFEFLVLESAQAGLSWITILKKRENYRKAYDNFDPLKVAAYDDLKINELLSNKGIIRNERKIRASIANAALFLQVVDEFGSFQNYFESFTGPKPIVNACQTLREIPAKTEISEKIAKDLRKRGFSFLGPTIVYSHLQAAGLVNDHTIDCFRYKELLNSYS